MIRNYRAPSTCVLSIFWLLSGCGPEQPDAATAVEAPSQQGGTGGDMMLMTDPPSTLGGAPSGEGGADPNPNPNAAGTPNAGGEQATGGQPANGGQAQGGADADGGETSGGAGGVQNQPPTDDWFPCDGDPGEYDATAINADGTWTVENNGEVLYTGSSMEQAMREAMGSLTPNRNEKESVLVLGDGTIDANTQLSIPSYTVLNVCGTIDVTGSWTDSDRSPIYARRATDIDIPHITITGKPQYAMFFRETNNVHLGQVVMRLDPDAGRGLRIDHSSSSSPGKPMFENYQIDYVFVSGAGGHGVETYGINNITINEFVGENTGNCGMLLNYTTNAEVGSVTCTGCAGGTTYAAFRIANQAGNVNDDDTYPAGNIHVGEINATGGGRGIFCVSASGGLTVDRFDIEDVGAAPEIFIENCYNITLATEEGTLTGGQARIGYNANNGPPSSNVVFQNMTLDNASILESPCDWGDLGNRALDVSGGSTDMCAN